MFKTIITAVTVASALLASPAPATAGINGYTEKQEHLLYVAAGGVYLQDECGDYELNSPIMAMILLAADIQPNDRMKRAMNVISAKISLAAAANSQRTICRGIADILLKHGADPTRGRPCQAQNRCRPE